MSGRHFDHIQSHIEDAADEVDRIMSENDSIEKNEYDEDIGCHYNSETIEKFKVAADTLRKAAVMLHRVDWLVSGDDGEESFHERWDEEINKCNSEA
jgi:hypothetical protein